MKSAIFASLLLLAACGRAGDPRPPIIRIPQKIENLSATQSGYTIVLSWTNPAKYVDGNPATDTGMVHVFRNNIEIGMVAATAAGQRQSFSVDDVKKSLGSSLTFAVQLVVPKSSKPSPVSNEVLMRPVDVPGSPRNVVPTVDQGKIVLVWQPPERNAELVDAYVVQRSDKPAASRVSAPRFEDTEYEPGKAYNYTITAVRGTSPQVTGDGNLVVRVVATDMVPPATPTGLEVELLGTTVFLKWEGNTELDLKGYQVYRSDRPQEPIFTVANAYSDSDYVPGRVVSYQVVAVDVSGNPSPKSAPKVAP